MSINLISRIGNLKTADEVAEFYVRLAHHEFKTKLNKVPDQNEISAFAFGVSSIMAAIPGWITEVDND